MESVNIKKYLIQGGAWALVGKILTALMGLVLSALLARMLSPEKMGAYFLAFNLATFFAIFARFGIESTLLRFVSEAMAILDYGNARVSIQKGFLLVLVFSLIVSIALYTILGKWIALYLFESQSLVIVLGLVSVWVILLSFQMLFGEINRAFSDIRSASLFGGVIPSILSSIFLTWLWIWSENVTLKEVLFCVLLAGAVNFLIASLMLWRRLAKLKPDPVNEEGFSEIISHSWPLFLNSLTLFVMAHSSLWIVAAFLSDEEVAIFGSVTRLVLLTAMALSVVNAVIPPLISQLSAQNQKDKLEKILRLTASIAAIPSVIILLLYMIFGNYVLSSVFGVFYSQGAIILAILSFAQIVYVFVGSCGYVLVMNGFQKTMMFISMGSMVLAVSLGIGLVKLYGTFGVAIACALSLIIQQILLLYFARRNCRLWTHVDIFLPLRGKNY